jgi:hypothetical protein
VAVVNWQLELELELEAVVKRELAEEEQRNWKNHNHPDCNW